MSAEFRLGWLSSSDREVIAMVCPVVHRAAVVVGLEDWHRSWDVRDGVMVETWTRTRLDSPSVTLTEPALLVDAGAALVAGEVAGEFRERCLYALVWEAMRRSEGLREWMRAIAPGAVEMAEEGA